MRTAKAPYEYVVPRQRASEQYYTPSPVRDTLRMGLTLPSSSVAGSDEFYQLQIQQS